MCSVMQVALLLGVQPDNLTLLLRNAPGAALPVLQLLAERDQHSSCARP